MTDNEIKNLITSHLLCQNIDFAAGLVVFEQFLKNQYYDSKESFIYTKHYNDLLSLILSRDSGEPKLDFEKFIKYTNATRELKSNFVIS